VLDNLSTHKTPAVHEWLLRHKRFHFHFTPTYESWMNLVERWLSALTTKTLQRSADPTGNDLAADLRSWAETWNDNPKPFTRHKSPDDIPQRLAGYGTAINQSDLVNPDRTLGACQPRQQAALRPAAANGLGAQSRPVEDRQTDDAVARGAAIAKGRDRRRDADPLR